MTLPVLTAVLMVTATGRGIMIGTQGFVGGHLTVSSRNSNSTSNSNIIAIAIGTARCTVTAAATGVG